MSLQRRKHDLDVGSSGSRAQKKRKIFVLSLGQQFLSLAESSFGRLTLDIMPHILENVPLIELGLLSMTSKSMTNIVLNELRSDSFPVRIADSLFECLTKKSIHEECGKVGLLLKRVTLIDPVQIRLNTFHLVTEKIRMTVEQSDKRLCCPDLNILFCVGTMLKKFIAGWDEDECFKVFNFMTDRLFLSQSMARFVGEDIGMDRDNERFLRQHFRHLILDQCSDDKERAMWIGFTFTKYDLSTAQLPKVILLLYGPTDGQGNVKWDFAFDVRAFHLYTGHFHKLARIIGLLGSISFWSPALSLQVLVYLSNTPNCWLLRSFSSLLLPLSCIDKDLVLEYFLVLYSSGRSSIATLLLALTLMISTHFIRYPKKHGVAMGKNCVHDLFKLVIDNVVSKLKLERLSVVRSIYDSVMNLAMDFAETAVQGDEEDESVEDFSDLVEAWMDLSLILMAD